MAKTIGLIMRQKIQNILSNLESIGEDLLALSDDIWLNIDHNDSDAVAKGAEFKIAFNNAVGEFSIVSSRLAQLVEEFTEVPPFEAPKAPDSPEERERRERTIRSLDQQVKSLPNREDPCLERLPEPGGQANSRTLFPDPDQTHLDMRHGQLHRADNRSLWRSH